MKIKKVMSILVLCSIILSLLAGCGSNSNAPAPTAGESGNASTQATVASAPVPKSNDFTKFDPPITITAAIAVREGDKLRNGDTVDDNPLSRWYRDTLGINLKYKWTLVDKDNALNTKIQLALSSGEELPDILAISSYTEPTFANLIESGKIQSIDESFDKYATERVKNAYAKNPTVWNYVKQDGKKWGMPQVADGFVGDTIMWIRQDWLDNVGLKAPTNVDEFAKVLDAFTNNDPDKNGKKDTYGLVIGANSGYKRPLGDWMADAQFLFGKNQPYMWVKGSDGKLTYGSIGSVVKDGLSLLHDWYQKGYLGVDFVTYDASKAAGDFTAGKAGIVFAPGWAGGWPVGDAVNEAKKSGKTFNAVPCNIPSGLNGDTGRAGSPISYAAYVFRKGFEHMDAILRVWDIFYGGQIEDPDFPFAKGYAEGYDYVMKDGKPDWTDIPGGSQTLDGYRLLSVGNTPPNVMEGPNIYQRVMQGKLDNVYEQKIKALNGETFLKGNATVFNQMNFDVPPIFIGMPTATMKDKNSILEALEEETQLKIIIGEKPVSYFDDFVKQWQDGGGKQITDEVNQWYQNVNK